MLKIDFIYNGTGLRENSRTFCISARKFLAKIIPAKIRPTVFLAGMRPVAGTVLAKTFAEILLNRFVAGLWDVCGFVCQ